MMVNKKRLTTIATLSAIILLSAAFHYPDENTSPEITGAWHWQEESSEAIMICKDGYFVQTLFDKANKKFILSRGGSYKTTNNKIVAKIEFDTEEEVNIGKEESINFSITGNKLAISGDDGKKREFVLLDNGNGDLAGVWRITGRMVEGKLNEMPRRDRKTLKIISGTRFQWMAINPATKEFFGTGGGTYTFKDGKYTEHIEFFSRDNSRVGASLTFDGAVKDGVWNHSGKSSKGDPINEIWTKEKY